MKEYLYPVSITYRRDIKYRLYPEHIDILLREEFLFFFYLPWKRNKSIPLNKTTKLITSEFIGEDLHAVVQNGSEESHFYIYRKGRDFMDELSTRISM